MNKIKVLHIIKSLGRGGAEMLLPETLKIHTTSKFEFHYIYFLPWKDQMVSSLEEAGGKVTCFSASNNIKLLQQYSRVIDYCKTNTIDIIHCHLPWAGFLGRLVFAKTKVPVVYTEHNMQERYHIATKKINQFTFNSQSLALGVSEDVTNSIKNNINPKIPVKTLLNGANTDTFRRDPDLGIKIKRELSISKDALVIGNVAVFRFQKRLVEWLQVFKKIETKNPNVYGIIVGAGPLEEEIIQELKRLKLEKKVKFTGLQTDVKPYFSAMDIFMMSSSFEGLPIALLEAMSMECAVVSTDAGGIKEVIRDEQDGLMCKIGEWEKLSGLCQVLIDDPEKLLELKKAARERAVNSFSLKRMVDSLEDIYGSLVSEGVKE
ncbi:glycosyltransferase involved in cell wall biosynthesis [Gillisia sp. Hel_I_86]|uniref:glycosyltransferase n=1 Tax=Gillisia sp. Hel_I_86 TaxID=1249981 RepID=UPI00119921A3|nr:glycosyltransferase [Gillisia sp. Hel_I_86]TVZ28228.1 glycosyltransferase involved in cell wall biosynthesis [Gillisia sp. Hel_I_86]